MATWVGLDPHRDIRWDFHPSAQAKQLLAERKVDVFLGFPPDPQELRARKIGRMLISSTVDRPWSRILLLHGRGQPGLPARASGRDQARDARDPEGL